MRYNDVRVTTILAVALLAAAIPAAAQSWRQFAYPEAGFAVQLPGEPSVERGYYTATGGVSVPATIYVLRQPNVELSMTIADLTGTPIDNCNVIDLTVRALELTGEIRTDVTTEIDDHYGRELSITEKDGGRSIFAIFYFNHRLYKLQGHVRPPYPERRAAAAIRFQQSLSFIGQPVCW